MIFEQATTTPSNQNLENKNSSSSQIRWLQLLYYYSKIFFMKQFCQSWLGFEEFTVKVIWLMFRLETGNDMHSSSQFDSSQFAKYQKYCIVNCDYDDAFNKKRIILSYFPFHTSVNNEFGFDFLILLLALEKQFTKLCTISVRIGKMSNW